MRTGQKRQQIIRMIAFCDPKLHIERKGHQYPDFKSRGQTRGLIKKLYWLYLQIHIQNPVSSYYCPCAPPVQDPLPLTLLRPQPVLWSPGSTDSLCLHSNQIASVLSDVLLTYSADLLCHCSLLWSLHSSNTFMLPLEIRTHSRSAPAEPLCCLSLCSSPSCVHGSLLLTLPMMLPIS